MITTLRYSDILATGTKVSWLVPGILPAQGLGLLYGPPGVGKTFIGLDLALTLAAGWTWPNHGLMPPPDEQALRDGVPVLYWIGEGEITARSRLRAWHETRFGKGSTRDLPFHFMDQRHPDLLLGQPFLREDSGRRTVSELIAALRTISTGYKRGPLLVVDTLAATHPGLEENDARATGVLIENCRRIITEAGAAILLIHHSGKNRGGGPRGHSRLTGDPDLVLHVARLKKPHTDFIRCDVEKQRMQQPPAPFYFSLTVPLERAADEKDAERATEPMPVLTYHEAPPVRSPTKPGPSARYGFVLSKGQRTSLRIAEILRDLPGSDERGFSRHQARKAVEGRTRLATSTIYGKLSALKDVGLITNVPGTELYRLTEKTDERMRTRILAAEATTPSASVTPEPDRPPADKESDRPPSAAESQT